MNNKIASELLKLAKELTATVNFSDIEKSTEKMKKETKTGTPIANAVKEIGSSKTKKHFKELQMSIDNMSYLIRKDIESNE